MEWGLRMKRTASCAALLAALLSACSEPIECDIEGYRITPEGASRERASDDNEANTDLLYRRTLADTGSAKARWMTDDSLSKAVGCP